VISYGVGQIDQLCHAASYVNPILKGKKPADLPVPSSLLAIADEVIE
jgi:ABC-type uncharacterized transport system substrate-binding protein